MSKVIIRKTYENAQLKATGTGFLLFIRQIDLDKFILQTFNRLTYEKKIIGPLITSCLLNFSDYYSHDILF